MNKQSKIYIAGHRGLVGLNHIGLRGQVKWRVSPHFVH